MISNSATTCESSSSRDLDREGVRTVEQKSGLRAYRPPLSAVSTGPDSVSRPQWWGSALDRHYLTTSGSTSSSDATTRQDYQHYKTHQQTSRSTASRTKNAFDIAHDITPVRLVRLLNYRAHISLRLTQQKMLPIIAVLDTSSGSNLIRYEYVLVPAGWKSLPNETRVF